MKQRWVQIIIVISTLICFLWLVGIGMTFKDTFFRDTTVSNLSEDKEADNNTDSKVQDITLEGYHILALGDSLTKGTGDPEGKGYVGYVVESLQSKTNEKVNIQNLGIDGYRSEQLVELIKQNEVQRQINMATTILLTIGGNDLFQSGQTLIELDIEKIEVLQEDYISNINQILTTIREVNKEAPIFISGLYNPFIELEDSETTSKVIMDWNHRSAIEISKFPKTVFVPTFDLYQLQVEQYLSTDQFHLNTLGYQRMAERIATLITWVGEEQ